MNQASRASKEIEHGRKLAQRDTELVWGWGSPAGRLRATRRAELIVAGARLGPGRRALEIGCGTGLFTEMFAKTGASIVAVDLSPELLEKARARGLPADRVRFLEMPFEECDVADPFDAVIGSSILHHLDLRPALMKIRSLLKPGGVMCFGEPNMLNPQIALQKNIPWLKRRLGDSPDETAFVRWALCRLLRETGFEQATAAPMDFLHPGTPRALIPAVAAIGRLCERIPLIKEVAGSLLIRAVRPAGTT